MYIYIYIYIYWYIQAVSYYLYKFHWNFDENLQLQSSKLFFRYFYIQFLHHLNNCSGWRMRGLLAFLLIFSCELSVLDINHNHANVKIIYKIASLNDRCCMDTRWWKNNLTRKQSFKLIVYMIQFNRNVL